jgi:hypothetical protein
MAELMEIFGGSQGVSLAAGWDVDYMLFPQVVGQNMKGRVRAAFLKHPPFKRRSELFDGFSDGLLPVHGQFLFSLLNWPGPKAPPTEHNSFSRQPHR